MQNNKDRLELSDIAYHGKPVNTLTKKELQEAFLEIARQLYNCTSKKEKD